YVPVRPDGGGLRCRDYHQQRRSRVRLHGLRQNKRTLKIFNPAKGYAKNRTGIPAKRGRGHAVCRGDKTVPFRSRRKEMTAPVRIAQLSCGADYSGVQEEINTAARSVNGEIFFPDIALKDIVRDFEKFG